MERRAGRFIRMECVVRMFTMGEHTASEKLQFMERNFNIYLANLLASSIGGSHRLTMTKHADSVSLAQVLLIPHRMAPSLHNQIDKTALKLAKPLLNINFHSSQPLSVPLHTLYCKSNVPLMPNLNIDSHSSS